MRSKQLQLTKIEEYKSELLRIQIKHKSHLENQKNVLAVAENKIDLYQDTRMIDVALRSSSRVGKSRSLVLALSLSMGLIGGIMLSFLVEFISNARAETLKKSVGN